MSTIRSPSIRTICTHKPWDMVEQGGDEVGGQASQLRHCCRHLVWPRTDTAKTARRGWPASARQAVSRAALDGIEPIRLAIDLKKKS